MVFDGSRAAFPNLKVRHGNGTHCYSCIDNIQNDDETAVDWGGHCGFPYFVKCNNNILDNVTSETSIDYGGDCGNCENTSITEDLNLNLLIEGGLIVYPFNSTQCDESEAVQGGIVFFVVLISSILLVPVILILVVLIVVLVIGGVGVGGLFAGLFGGGRNNKKDDNNDEKDKK